MPPGLRPTYQTVSVPAAFSGGTLFDVPAGASDVTLSAPAGSVGAELAVRPVSIAGEATSIASSSTARGTWSMRPSGAPTALDIGVDVQNDSGGALDRLVTIWT